MEFALFWLFVNTIFWLLRLRPNSLVSRTAFSWFGPRPLSGESWARYQLRWSLYSLGWFLQFTAVFSVLVFAAARWKLVELEGFFGVLIFGLPFGIAMAALAALGFALRAAKAHIAGPNPTYEGSSGDSAA
jgi:hypothetical protein